MIADFEEEVVSKENPIKQAGWIVLGCALFVMGFSCYLWAFHGYRKTYVLEEVLTAPHQLLCVRVNKKALRGGPRKLLILDKISLSFFEASKLLQEFRLMPEEYKEVFSWICNEIPLAQQFSDHLIWPGTMARLSLYVRSVDLLDQDSSEVYQTLECSSDGALFRVSPKLDNDKEPESWTYYHNEFLLKALIRRFLERDE